MYKIGMSSCAFPLNEEVFQSLSQHGIQAIEIAMSGEEIDKLDFQEVFALSRRYQVQLWSCHLPFSPWGTLDISTPDEAMRRRTIEYYRELIRKASDIGVAIFVLHPSLEPIAPENREQMISYAMDSLRELAQIAADNNAVIAIEDLPRTCLGNTAEEMHKLLSADERLRVCFDTNHLLQDTQLNFVEKLGDKIVTLHVSDYDYADERHWLPGEGKINWHELYAALKAANYTGVWMYEVPMELPTHPDRIQNLARRRDLTLDDFVCNAEEIFAEKQPCAIK